MEAFATFVHRLFLHFELTEDVSKQLLCLMLSLYPINGWALSLNLFLLFNLWLHRFLIITSFFHNSLRKLCFLRNVYILVLFYGELWFLDTTRFGFASEELNRRVILLEIDLFQTGSLEASAQTLVEQVGEEVPDRSEESALLLYHALPLNSQLPFQFSRYFNNLPFPLFRCFFALEYDLLLQYHWVTLFLTFLSVFLRMLHGWIVCGIERLAVFGLIHWETHY